MNVGKIGKLIDASYQDVARVTLSGTKPWPDTILYGDRVFLIYQVTRSADAVEDTELYREVTFFRVPV
jgi:hypothetical protein